VAGDGMSGWHVTCHGCAAEYLLPGPLAVAGARVRCPACAASFLVADPARARAFRQAALDWIASRPGGLAAVRRARDDGRFWEEHGESLLAAFEQALAADAGGADETDAATAAAFQGALARVLGPGRVLFG